MKRFIGGTIAVLLTTMIFTGCGSKDAGSGDNSNPNPNTNESTQSANNTSSSAVQGRGQFQRPDAMGEVVSVSGNDISLKLLKMPQGMGNGQRHNGQNGNGQGAPKDQQGNPGQGDKQNPPDNQGQGDQQNRQGQGGGPRNRQGGNFQREYTGETQTITVPSGVSIEENTFSNGKRETKNIEVKDLKQGDILQVRYADKDKKTISKIQVMTIPARPQQNGQQPNDQQNKQ